MARTAQYDETQLAWAQLLIETATTVQQLRRGQAMLLPALTGASMDTTAKLLGVGRNQVCVLRRQLRSPGIEPSSSARDGRGGRRQELLSVQEETLFLQRWLDQAKDGAVLVVAPIHIAFEKKVGRQVPKSTIYRMLGRHGWRRS